MNIYGIKFTNFYFIKKIKKSIDIFVYKEYNTKRSLISKKRKKYIEK